MTWGRGAVINSKYNESGRLWLILKGITAEGISQTKAYFWVFIKYVDNCHESVELQGISFN